MSIFKSKASVLEKNKQEILKQESPKRIQKELYQVTVKKILRTMKEDTDEKYFVVATMKETGWSEWYEAQNNDETKDSIVKVKVPNGEFKNSDSSYEIFDQQFDTLDISKLTVYLNLNQQSS